MADEAYRSFVAVDLSDEARLAAAALSKALRDVPDGGEVRWVRPETLHVTLRFFGDVETSRLPALASGLRDALGGVASFELALGAARVFPSRRQPRVIALGVTPEEPLAALAAASERVAVAQGFAPEHRAFRAHLTLGRVRGRRAPNVGGVAPPPPSPFEVTEAVLFRSELRPEGARYTPLERFALGGSVHPSHSEIGR